nr:MAG TPA: hypothetical protein [Caudoviricetes sp.]
MWSGGSPKKRSLTLQILLGFSFFCRVVMSRGVPNCPTLSHFSGPK